MADDKARAQLGVLIAATAGNFVCATPAVQTVFGIFLVPISTEFHWPRAQVSGVLTLMAVVTALAYPALGRASDRWGARRLILPGNLAFAASVAALSLADGRLWQFYALFAVMSVASAVPSTMMFTKVVAGWFEAARGRAEVGGSGIREARPPPDARRPGRVRRPIFGCAVASWS